MRPISHFPVRLGLAVALFGAIALSGCGGPSASSEPASTEDKIQGIQNNNALSPSEKAAAIAAEKAKKGSSTQ